MDTTVESFEAEFEAGIYIERTITNEELDAYLTGERLLSDEEFEARRAQGVTQSDDL